MIDVWVLDLPWESGTFGFLSGDTSTLQSPLDNLLLASACAAASATCFCPPVLLLLYTLEELVRCRRSGPQHPLRL